MSQLTQFQACKVIANTMTNKGFMNGWFGDTSDEFKLEQANALHGLPKGPADCSGTAAWWVDLNLFNMTHYCRIPAWVIVEAFGVNLLQTRSGRIELTKPVDPIPKPLTVGRLLQTSHNCHYEEETL